MTDDFVVVTVHDDGSANHDTYNDEETAKKMAEQYQEDFPQSDTYFGSSLEKLQQA